MAITGGGSVVNFDDAISDNFDIRSYNFDASINAGLSSAGSSITLNAPAVSLFSGALSAPPQSKGREMGEKTGPNSDIWTGFDGLNYWGRKMFADVYISIAASNLTWIAGNAAMLYMGLYLFAPGLPPWNLTPGVPYAMILYKRLLDVGGAVVESWELWTAEGNTNSAKVTVLSGVQGPASPITPGGGKTQRISLLYEPGVACSAYVDGVLGAKHTTNLPVTSTIPTLQVLGGIGVYVDSGQGADSARADFHRLKLGTKR